MNFSFTKHIKIFTYIPVVIIIVALIFSISGNGLNIGIDFAGGALMRYDIGSAFEYDQVYTILDEMGIKDRQLFKTGEGDVHDILEIRLKDENSTDETRTIFEDKLVEKFPNATFLSIDRVGAIAGRDLLKNAIYSLLIVGVFLLIYIAIRFDAVSGIAAIFALLHDIAIMVCSMVFFSYLFQINSSFIATVLTIIGYSINNTIVIFDRIRENRHRSEFAHKSRMEIADSSIRSTFNRTVSTTITTLFSIVPIFIFGVETIREFTFPIIIGLLAGVYSSVFLSSQLWAFLMDRDIGKKLGLAKK